MILSKLVIPFIPLPFSLLPLSSLLSFFSPF
jgi:hypothetical protein